MDTHGAGTTPIDAHARYRAIVENLPDAVVVMVDHDLRIRLVAGRALERAGWRADELMDRRLSDVLPGEVAGNIEARLSAALAGQHGVIPAFPAQRADILWELQFGPARDNGSILGALLLARDVTEAERMQQRLRESEERVRATFDSAGAGVVNVGLDGRFLSVNRRFCEITGYPEPELLGLSVRDITHPEDIEVEQAQLDRLAAGEIPWFSLQKRYIRKDGATAWAIITRSALRRPDGKPYELVGTVSDITETVEMYRLLRESHARFRATFDNSASGVANVGLDGRFLRVNRRFCEITGYSEAEMLERTFQDITYPDDLEADLDQVRALADGEIPWYSMEKRYVRKDGAVVWVMLTAAAIRDEADQAVEFVASVADVTAQRRAQDEVARLNVELEQRVADRTAALVAANERLTAANRELDSFTYMVSHDLRAPLRTISGFADLLVAEHGQSLAGEAREFVDLIVGGAQQMRQLVDDLLAFSRASRHEVRADVVDMTSVASAQADGLRGQEPDGGIAVDVDDLPSVRGDRTLLAQVWQNLLSNAVKFTAGREDARVHVTGERRDGQVVYHVADNGVGFDMADADRLFAVFQRLHSEKDYPGTGVGLSIVDRIVTRHGGRVWAEAERGKGATFSFALPAVEAPAPAPGQS